jgi:hypothetical protein
VYDDTISGQIYRALTRYAVDLLFGPELGSGWHICDADGTMLGKTRGQSEPKCIQCGGKMRPIEPKDLGAFGEAMAAACEAERGESG